MHTLLPACWTGTGDCVRYVAAVEEHTRRALDRRDGRVFGVLATVAGPVHAADITAHGGKESPRSAMTPPQILPFSLFHFFEGIVYWLCVRRILNS